jgi:hypothetical protein
MLVKKFKFKRNNDKGGSIGRRNPRSNVRASTVASPPWAGTLADVKEFAALVRLCERKNSLERLSEMHLPGWEKRMQTTWGGNWFPNERNCRCSVSV